MSLRYVGIFLMFFTLKCTQAWYLYHLTVCKDPQIALSSFSLSSGDTFSYTGAMENYITHGDYYFFNGKNNVYAGRLPHYSIPYYMFRSITDQQTSYTLLTLLQLLLESIACAWLVLTFFKITNYTAGTILLFITLLISSNWTSFSLYASPESLSCTFLILFFCNYTDYLIKNKLRSLAYSGLLLGLLITLKAYFIVLFLPIGIHFIIDSRPFSLNMIKRVTYKALLVSFPMILLLIPWTIRNYKIYSQFIPLQINSTAGYNYTQAELSFRRFVSAWGDDFIYWERTSAGCYFIPSASVACDFKIPEHALTKSYTLRDIEKAREEFIQLQHTYSDSLNNKVTSDFDRLTNLYISEKPLQYYVVSPVRLVKKFLVHSGSYYLPIHKTNPCFNSFQLSIKLTQSALYWGALLSGIIGLILLGKNLKDIVVPSIPVFIIIFFAIIFRAVEARYFRTVEPLLYVGMIYLLLQVKNRLHTGKSLID